MDIRNIENVARCLVYSMLPHCHKKKWILEYVQVPVLDIGVRTELSCYSRSKPLVTLSD